jgi:hypothetical protein
MEEQNNNINDQVPKKEECVELKNIKYKTMLLNGNTFKETKLSHNLSSLEKFLEDEKNNNKNEPWCKLDKTMKTAKLLEYVEEYKEKHQLEEHEKELLIQFFKECLEKKKLQRVKDVVYDKTTGTIKEVPGLVFTKANKHFTLKNLDKRVSTLKSLTPKKVQGTIRNKPSEKKIDSSSEDEN